MFKHALILPAALLGLSFLTATPTVHAADKKVEAKSDPSGTWTWSFTTPNGDTFNPTLKLQLAGETLTGTVTGRRGGDTAITEAKFSKTGEIAFVVVRERDGNKMITKYQGKLAGDSIKGTIESNRNGELQKRDWDAKREGAVATPPAANPVAPAKPAPAPAPKK